MKKAILGSSGVVYVVHVGKNSATIFGRPRDPSKKDVYITVAEGKSEAEGLLSAGKSAGLSDIDIATLAHVLSIELPSCIGTAGAYEPRGRANRFEPVPH